MLKRILCLTLAFAASAAFAEDFRLSRQWIGDWGGGTSGHDDFSIQPFNTPTKPFHPDAEMQKRLVVEWGKAAMGYLDFDSDETDDCPIWRDDISLRPDRMLSIRGRLMIQSDDGKTRQPVDWPQPVRIIVSTLPETKHDWSQHQDVCDAVWDHFIIWGNGKFMAVLPPNEVRRLIEKDAQFQVALSLGQQEETLISWTNAIGVLPQSVKMLTIPGVPVVSQTMQMINGAPSYEQDNFNPVKLIRAVNHLMPLGKEKAIAALRDFLKVARNDDESLRIDENIDTSDKTCVFLIVRLLFEPADGHEVQPGIATVPFTPMLKEAERKFWPLHPVHLQDDVPFFLVYGGAMGGMPDQPENHVDWAEEHGKIRSKPFKPLDNPMTAANCLIALPQTERLFDEGNFTTDYAALLRQQAWNIIEHSDPTQKKLFAPADEYEEIDWDARLKTAAELRIHWNEMENRYVIGE